MYICVIYIYCVCVILKSPMSPWCVLLTWQGAKKAILWTAVPSWNQEPRCFGGGTITMFSTFHWNIHCRFFPTSYASVIRSSWPVAHCQGDRQYRPKPDDDTADTASRQHLCASKPAAHNAHKQLTDAMNNLLAAFACIGVQSKRWSDTMEEDNEDLGAWKVGVVMKLYRPLCVNAPATSCTPSTKKALVRPGTVPSRHLSDLGQKVVET